jgi:hypothetical protein
LSATFADKTVANAKTVTATGLNLSGADAGNYTVNATASTTADITPKPITGVVTASNKVYDAGVSASIASRSLTGAVTNDDVSLTGGTATFADKIVGNGKTVTATGLALGGTAAANYALASTTAATTADITPLAITGSITAASKVYDGNSTAQITGRTLSGVLATDAVTYSGGTATFNNKNVGAGKTVSATGLALAGAEAANYTVNAAASTTAEITARPLVVTATGVNRVYDGTTAATATLADNRVTGDVLTAGYGSATFGDKNVGTGKSVSVSAIAITGADAGNYTANATASTAADITPRPITVTPGAPDLTWTGSALTPAYSYTVTTGNLINGDPLGTASYSPATVTNVGSYTVTVSGLANSNYAITPAPGSVTVVDQTHPIANITSLNPVPLNTAASLQVNVTDVATGNSKIVAWKYSIDGVYQPEMSISAASQVPNATLTTSVPGANSTDVIQICVQGQDAGGMWSKETCGLLAVYDPTAGFVTGGGWIDSPSGAYAAEPSLIGKATFGFVSKYQKGAAKPSGNTEFQFQAVKMNFKSSAYEWLVVNGTTQAQFKGTGSINGAGNYGFLVTALDGDNFGTKKPDAFRIKIWDIATGITVYDNQMGKSETGADATTISGGSIQIQAK